MRERRGAILREKMNRAQITLKACVHAGARFIFIPMRIEKASSTVFTPLADGTGVLLNLDTLCYYSLNRTGAAIWQQIEESKSSTLDDLIRDTCERFDVDEEAAGREVNSFLRRLEEFKMVRTTAP